MKLPIKAVKRERYKQKVLKFGNSGGTGIHDLSIGGIT
jgi:hypothetical protein